MVTTWQDVARQSVEVDYDIMWRGQMLTKSQRLRGFQALIYYWGLQPAYRGLRGIETIAFNNLRQAASRTYLTEFEAFVWKLDKYVMRPAPKPRKKAQWHKREYVAIEYQPTPLNWLVGAIQAEFRRRNQTIGAQEIRDALDNIEMVLERCEASGQRVRVKRAGSYKM